MARVLFIDFVLFFIHISLSVIADNAKFKVKKKIYEKEKQFLIKITVLEQGLLSAQIRVSYNLSLCLVVCSLVIESMLGISYALCSLLSPFGSSCLRNSCLCRCFLFSLPLELRAACCRLFIKQPPAATNTTTCVCY